MKPRWTAYISIVAIACVIIAGGFLMQEYLDKTAGKLVYELEEVRGNIIQGNWEEGRRRFSAFENQWRQVRENWALFIDHLEIDNVQTKLSRTEEFLRAGDESNASAELGEAIMLIRHIPDKERLTWRNLF